LALRYVRDLRIDGVVYNMDDDNAYDSSLWAELRKLHVGRVGVFAVRMTEQGFLERPLYDDRGVFRGFDAGWCRSVGWATWTSRRLGPRFFCIDMGGFAFSAELLWATGVRRRPNHKPWDYEGVLKFSRWRRRRPVTEWRGGETEFVQSLLPNGFPEDLQPLGNCGLDVLVFHNGYSAMTSGPDSRSRFYYSHWLSHARVPPVPWCKPDGW